MHEGQWSYFMARPPFLFFRVFLVDFELCLKCLIQCVQAYGYYLSSYIIFQLIINGTLYILLARGRGHSVRMWDSLHVKLGKFKYCMVKLLLPSLPTRFRVERFVCGVIV